jgi:O-antigen biosynthesis protein WbqP
MKRLWDLVLVVFLSFFLFLPFLLIVMLMWITSGRPILHWSKRIGKNNHLFLMPKLRTMKLETPQVATHLLKDSSSHLTALGSFLRKTSIDEWPQLWSVWKGDMSFVGPRPALFNQVDLITLRTNRGIHQLKPGITGLAQIKGRDDLSIEEKVDFDDVYRQQQSLKTDMKILLQTCLKVLRSEGVHH